MNSALLDYARSLDEKSSTTIRFFEKDDYFCLAEDAELISNEYFKTKSVLKNTKEDSEYITITTNVFEQVLKFVLLVKRYRLEIHAYCQGSWMLRTKSSPGNLGEFESLLKDSPANVNGICAAKFKKADSGSIRIGFSFIDLDNFIFYVYDFVDDDSFANLESVLTSLSPKECLTISKIKNQIPDRVISNCGLLVTPINKKDADISNIKSDFEFLLNTAKSDTEIIKNPLSMKDSITCLSGSIKYMMLLDNENLMGKFTLKKFNLSNYVRLDNGAVSALHLVNDENKKSKNSSIFGILNRCQTIQGQRLLYLWIHQPLYDIKMINERLDLTESLMKNTDVYNFIRQEFLIGFPDLCSFVKRLVGKNADLKDCYKLYCAIRKLEKLLAFIGNYEDEDSENLHLFRRNFVEPVRTVFNELANFKSMIEDTIDFSKVDDNEYSIRPDFNEELDFLNKELKSLDYKFDNQFQLAAKELYLGQNKSIKMEFATSRGFYFKCTLKEEKNLRGLRSYSIFETSKSGVKFTNNEMEQLNQDYLNYTQQFKKLHSDLVQEIVNISSEYSDQFIILNEISANLDTICSFVNFAFNSPSAVCRPKILNAEEGLIEFRDMKHPLLERFFEGCVIPNDLKLSKNKDENGKASYFHVITGPNMGGKSTFIRTAALMVYLSQIGCFVPCSHATVSLVDAILVRIGADDNINRGISTFMAEMLDTSSIIRNSTENSLVVVDELGRGTSTYDGLGLTWSISQHIHDNIKCYCLFATHFHEMTSISTVCGNIANFYSSAIESSDGITMLYRIEPGISKQSYGLNVARVCGFPKNVIDEAEKFAKEYEYVQCHDMTKLSNDCAHEVDDLENFIRQFFEQTREIDDMQQKISILENMIKSSNSIELKNVWNLIQNGA